MPEGKQSTLGRRELFFVRLIAALIAGLSGVGALLALLVPLVWTGFQALGWLSRGFWTPQPALLDWICGVSDSICSAVTYPQTWIGVAKLFHRALDVPAGMGFVYAGAIFFAVHAVARDWVNQLDRNKSAGLQG